MKFKYTLIRIIGLLLMCYSTINSAAIVIGNPNGTVILTEVYDYSCIHCHRIEPSIEELIKRNPNLKVRLFPVALIDDDSIITASTAWSVAKKSDQFLAFHHRLLSGSKPDATLVNEVLAELHLDTTLLQKIQSASHQNWVEREITRGINLLKTYHSGTPLILITSNSPDFITKVFRGETSLTTLQQAVAGEL